MVINALTLSKGLMLGTTSDKITLILRLFDVAIGIFFYITAIQYYSKLTRSKTDEEKLYSTIEHFEPAYVEMNRARYQANPGSSFLG